jgi:G3E family GTPase
MIKIDLVTGFLGAGKTTFINEYVKYLKKIGENVCVIENDYGAINVDALFVGNLCDVYMVAGGCDYDCHLRRFQTKLISIAMRGYTRVVVEPSGIYDTSEFFDSLYEDNITQYYEIGNVFNIYDINTKGLSEDGRYILVSEMAQASKIIVSKRVKDEAVDIHYINDIFKEYMCDRVISESDIIYFDTINMADIINSGYYSYEHIHKLIMDNNSFDSVYIMDRHLTISQIETLKNLFKTNTYGNIIRIKGFVKEMDTWYQINITKNESSIKPIELGQDVVIVIGEGLNKKEIEELI